MDGYPYTIELEEKKKLAKVVWAEVLDKLHGQYPPLLCRLWFDPIQAEFFDGHNFVLSVDSDLKRDTVEHNYIGTVETFLKEALGMEPIVYIWSTESGPVDTTLYLDTEAVPDENGQMPEPREPVIATPIYASAEFTFDNFIIGNGNRFAQAACYAVATGPSDGYNPLFIHGGSGLGKTHLLYAIMNEIHRANPERKVLYVKGEEFTNELVDSLKLKTQQAFRAKYRKVDVLLIDDIQFIAGKDGIQDEFFHTFNALFEDHRQIILAADRPPRDMRQLEDRLKTRFEWGLLADIQPPDYELRVAILKKKAQMLGLQIPNEMINYVAENLRSNIRQLEGAIKKIRAHAFISGNEVTFDLVRQVTAEFAETTLTDPGKAEKLIQNVSKKYGVSVDDIKGRRRVAEIVNARHIAIYLIRRETELSLPSIGNIFDRDHTTIMSSIATVERMKHERPLFEMELMELAKIQ